MPDPFRASMHGRASKDNTDFDEACFVVGLLVGMAVLTWVVVHVVNWLRSVL